MNFYTIQCKVNNCYRYHTSAIRNYFKYGSYFGDREAYSFPHFADEYTIPRLKRLREWQDKFGSVPMVTSESIKMFNIPDSYFDGDQGECKTLTLEGWNNILETIIEGFELEEPNTRGSNNEKIEVAVWAKQMEEYSKQKQRARLLFGLFYDNLWH